MDFLGRVSLASIPGMAAAVGVLATMGPTWTGLAIVANMSFTASLLVLSHRTPVEKRRVEARWGALADRTL